MKQPAAINRIGAGCAEIHDPPIERGKRYRHVVMPSQLAGKESSDDRRCQ